MRKFTLTLIGLAALSLANAQTSDTLFLKDGRIITGKITYMNNREIYLQQPSGLEDDPGILEIFKQKEVTNYSWEYHPVHKFPRAMQPKHGVYVESGLTFNNRDGNGARTNSDGSSEWNVDPSSKQLYSWMVGFSVELGLGTAWSVRFSPGLFMNAYHLKFNYHSSNTFMDGQSGFIRYGIKTVNADLDYISSCSGIAAPFAIRFNTKKDYGTDLTFGAGVNPRFVIFNERKGSEIGTITRDLGEQGEPASYTAINSQLMNNARNPLDINLSVDVGLTNYLPGARLEAIRTYNVVSQFIMPGIRANSWGLKLTYQFQH